MTTIEATLAELRDVSLLRLSLMAELERVHEARCGHGPPEAWCEVSAVFEARYAGRCGVCDEAIRPGDRATFVDDEIAHAACPEPIALADPCPHCFMIPATNGTCGCDR